MPKQNKKIESKQYDLCIVGGGLVGLSCLLALKQHFGNQYSIALIDPHLQDHQTAKPFSPSFDERQTALSLSTVEFLKSIHLWSSISQYAQAIKQIDISSQGQWGSCHLDSQQQSLAAFGYLVPNKALGLSLLHSSQLLSGVDFLTQSVDGISSTGNHAYRYQLQLDNQQSIQSRLTIICDGGRSNLKQQLGFHARRDYQSYAIISTVKSSQAHDGKAFERFHENGPIALLPKQAANESAVVFSTSEQELYRQLQLDESRFLKQLEQQFGRRLGSFTELGQRHHYPLTLSISQEQTRPGLMLLGNSAISLHPVAGQGLI